LRKSPVSRSEPDFPFDFPATIVYRRLPLLRSFSALVPEPKNWTRPAGSLPEPKGHNLSNFKAISQTLPPTPLRQMLFDQFAEPEPLVEFAHQDQATVRSDAGALELGLERGVEGELKGPILYLTH
jgi:hypothetical protein